jgi:hypothetical protein
MQPVQDDEFVPAYWQTEPAAESAAEPGVPFLANTKLWGIQRRAIKRMKLMTGLFISMRFKCNKGSDEKKGRRK